jgi:hypothetical protein
MPKEHSGKWVSYLRVSTERQGESGQGLEAQRTAVTDYLNGGNGRPEAEYVETESGKRQAVRQPAAATRRSRRLQEAEGQARRREARPALSQLGFHRRADGLRRRVRRRR